MDENIISLIAKELNISISQVKNTLELLEEGATVFGYYVDDHVFTHDGDSSETLLCVHCEHKH